MLRAIRMCLRPNVDNGNNTTRPLVSLGCASGTNFTSGIIPSIWGGHRVLDIQDGKQKRLAPSNMMNN